MDTSEKESAPSSVPTQGLPAGLKIVDKYEPKLKTGQTEAPKTMLDPLTKRLIPVDQANEHMRIELIDPMWKKQKEIRQERDATTNLASGEEMSDTIHRMRSKKEEEFSIKRPSSSTGVIQQEMTDDMIDQQLKRQRMKAMGIGETTQTQTPQQVTMEVTPSVPGPRPLLPGMAAPTPAPTPAPAPPAASTPTNVPPPPPAAGPSAAAPRPSMSSMPSMPSMGMTGMPTMPMPGMMPGMMPRMPMPGMMPSMPMPMMGSGKNDLFVFTYSSPA